MDAEHFDALIRSLELNPGSRRGMVKALMATALGVLAPFSSLAEAKKKKRKKKKTSPPLSPPSPPPPASPSPPPPPPCRTAQQGCAGGCCSGLTCGDNFCASSPVCCGNVGAACAANCDCCGGVGFCSGGTCICNGIVCDGQCFDGTCCDDNDCGAGHVCDNHVCVCAGGFSCDTDCCSADSEVCHLPPVGAATCQAGSCPATDYCTNDDLYFCGEECVCVTSVDGTHACTDFAFDTCFACANDAACGPGAVCVPTGDFCDCPGNFCVPVGCPSGAAVSAQGGSFGARMIARKAAATGVARRLPSERGTSEQRATKRRKKQRRH